MKNGGQKVAFEGGLRCNYQTVRRLSLIKNRNIIQLSGTALFRGDIAPGVAVISGGTVTVFGETRNILQGMKARNPDGSVNYARLDII